MRKDEFKVGDEVYCLIYGKGVVENIEEGETYLVLVEFNNGNEEEYTEDGKLLEDGNRTLFFKEVIIPKSAYNKQKRRASKGDSYYFVNDIGEVCRMLDFMGRNENLKYNIGNYFSSEEEAKQSKFYKVFQE